MIRYGDVTLFGFKVKKNFFFVDRTHLCIIHQSKRTKKNENRFC